MKEEILDTSTCMGGWYIEDKICDRLIDFYFFNKEYATPGRSYSVEDAEVRPTVDKEIKDSMDLAISPTNIDFIVGEYRVALTKVLKKFLEKYPHANEQSFFNIYEDLNIQHYPVGGGFKKFHFENGGEKVSLKRIFVFMTYLNDVEDGGTEFKYQNIITEAKKGLTLIWPAHWTHTHRGIPSTTKEKFIITGWFSFND